MIKIKKKLNKKEFNHKLENICEACNVDEKTFDNFGEDFFKIIKITEDISKQVEKLENICEKYDPQILQRILLMNLVMAGDHIKSMTKKQALVTNLLKSVTKGGFENSEMLLELVSKINENSNVEIVNVTKESDPELYDQLMKEESDCDTCEGDDTCPNPHKKIDNSLKH